MYLLIICQKIFLAATKINKQALKYKGLLFVELCIHFVNRFKRTVTTFFSFSFFFKMGVGGGSMRLPA